MNLSQQSPDHKIKQETTPELTHFQQFSSIMASFDAQPIVTKEIILKLAWLFQKSYFIFAQCFEKAFLLIFKTYSNNNINLTKNLPHELAQPYSNLFGQFLEHLIRAVIGTQTIRQSHQDQEFLNSFINIYLRFFAQGLLAQKTFIKEFSFVMISRTLHILEPIFNPSLDQKTQKQLLDSTFSLLCSKSDENKRLGIELYAAFKKLNVTSQQTEELLLQYLEKMQNYNLRKKILHWGLDFHNKEYLDRVLNRLKDKNPLIAEELIKKLMHQNFSLRGMTFGQKIKLVVDGYGCHHKNVSDSCKIYFAKQFKEIFSQLQQNQQNHAQSFTQSQSNLMVSSNINMSVSVIQEDRVKKSNFVQQIIKLFNYNDLENCDMDLFIQNPFMGQFVCQIIFDVCCVSLSYQQICDQITQIFHHIQQACATSKECIFLYLILKGVFSNKKAIQNKNSQTEAQLKKFINNCSQMSSYQLATKFMINLFKQSSPQNLTSKYFLLKIIQQLAINVYDCVGKRKTYNMLKLILAENNFFQSFFRDQKSKNSKKDTNEKFQKTFYQQLSKINSIFSKKKSLKSSGMQLITCQADLIHTITGLLYKLIEKESSCQEGQLKLVLDMNFQNKQLRLQRQTLGNMYLKKNEQLQMLLEKEQKILDKKSIQNLTGLTKEIQKKISQNQLKIITNTLKALFMLAQMLCIKESKKPSCISFLRQINSSNYIQTIKIYLYNVIETINLSHENQLKICWIPYILLFNYCNQSKENFNNFKKLFFYHAFEQENSSTSKDALLQLLNLRILVELQLKQTINQSKGQNQHQLNDIAQKIIDKLFQKHFQNSIKSKFLSQLLIKITKAQSQTDLSYTLIIKVLLLCLKKSMAQSFNNQLIRTILMVLEQLSVANNPKGLEIILTYIQVINKLIKQLSKLKTEDDQKALTMSHLRKLNKTIIQINQRSLNGLQTQQKIKQILMRIPLILRTLQTQVQQQIALQVDFNFFQMIQSQKQDSCIFSGIQLEVLLYVKNQIQKFVQKLNFIQAHLFPSSQFQSLSHRLKNTLKPIQDQIQQTVKIQQTNPFEQQSTNHSHIGWKVQTSKQKINSQKIQIYTFQLQKRFDFLNMLSQKIFTQLKQSQFHQYLCKQFVVFVQINQPHSKEKPKIKKQEIKLEQKGPIQSEGLSLYQQISPISVAFDRRGRKKQEVLQKLKKTIEIRGASIKKSRFIIIPFDIIQAAQEKYGRTNFKIKELKKIMSNQQNHTSASQSCYGSLSGAKTQNFDNKSFSKQQKCQMLHNLKEIQPPQFQALLPNKI